MKPIYDLQWATDDTTAGVSGNPNKLEPFDLKSEGLPEAGPLSRQALNFQFNAIRLWKDYLEDVTDSLLVSSAAALQKSLNLSDLTNIATARSNLGLTSVATSAYASTSQAQSGTSTSTVMSPDRTTDHFNARTTTFTRTLLSRAVASDIRTDLGLGLLAVANSINNTNWSGTALSIANGGTGATSASTARSNLGLGSIAILSSINNTNWSGTDLAITNGGTGASDTAGARSNLGLTSSAITEKQGSRSDTTSGLLMINGAHGLGGEAIENSDWNNIFASGLYKPASSSQPELPSASTAFSMLHIQTEAVNATQMAFRSVSTDVRTFRRSRSSSGTWSGWAEVFDSSNTLGIGSTAASARTALGLGTLATASAINNTNWSGTDLSVTNGGTGASTLSGVLKGNGTGAVSSAGQSDIVNALTYTPVQQGTGTGQNANTIKIGWTSDSKIALEVDNSSFGANWPLTLTADRIVLGVFDLARIPELPTSKVTGLQTALDNKPSNTGVGANGTWSINISGNASTVSNGVYTVGSQTIAGSKEFTSYNTFVGNMGVGTVFDGETSCFMRLGYLPLDFYGFRLENRSFASAIAAGELKLQRGTSSSWQDVLTVGNDGVISIAEPVNANINGNAATATLATNALSANSVPSIDNFFNNKSLTTDGYQIFPGGFTIQWGQATVSGNGSLNINWPVPFGNNVLNATASLGFAFDPQTDAGAAIYNLTSTGATLRNGTTTGGLVRYMVFGF